MIMFAVRFTAIAVKIVMIVLEPALGDSSLIEIQSIFNKQ